MQGLSLVTSLGYLMILLSEEAILQKALQSNRVFQQIWTTEGLHFRQGTARYSE